MPEDIIPNTEGTNGGSVSRKSRKIRKGSLLFWFLLLLIGAVVGLHMNGTIDIRPPLWSALPKIPWVGPWAVETFEIPPEYTWTTAERRRFELDEWQRRLDEKERQLDAQSVRLSAVSRDVTLRSEDVGMRETAFERLQNEEPTPTQDGPDEQALLDQLTRTYQDISPRRAAQIVEQLNVNLAVKLMDRLNGEARAAILGRMEPARAAQLTERLANPR
jgi:flagellar motility protein MotE (MotC chaperone)